MARRLACLVLALGSSASAAGAPVPASDKRFLTEAAQGGLLEVQLGSLASRKGTLDDVTQRGSATTEVPMPTIEGRSRG